MPPCSCSSYVASRLRTYSENGRQLLDMMLAKAGIPIKQAQLPYIRKPWCPQGRPQGGCMAGYTPNVMVLVSWVEQGMLT